MTFDVALPAMGRRFACREGDSVLDAMRLVHHCCIDVGCSNGGCGVCKVRILSGSYRTGPMSAAHVSEAERAAGVALACRAYPTGPVTIEVLGQLPRKMAREFGFLAKP
ncbi:2Fe-2S iron-sulfur cluster-binding protein [Rhizorhabdus histidinilytica]|uniref:2Fe-2S iron-sulfur cluster-binding protein n=1 Tax=Rhizorhabdus histidinilytica TaxID=439228 RepID=UPI0032205D4F